MPDEPTVILPTVPFECPSCLRFLRVEANRAGTLVRCPVCRGMAKVPGESAVTPVPSDDNTTTPLGPRDRVGAASKPGTTPRPFPSALPLRPAA